MDELCHIDQIFKETWISGKWTKRVENELKRMKNRLERVENALGWIKYELGRVEIELVNKNSTKRV